MGPSSEAEFDPFILNKAPMHTQNKSYASDGNNRRNNNNPISLSDVLEGCGGSKSRLGGDDQSKGSSSKGKTFLVSEKAEAESIFCQAFGDADAKFDRSAILSLHDGDLDDDDETASFADDIDSFMETTSATIVTKSSAGDPTGSITTSATLATAAESESQPDQHRSSNSRLSQHLSHTKTTAEQQEAAAAAAFDPFHIPNSGCENKSMSSANRDENSSRYSAAMSSAADLASEPGGSSEVRSISMSRHRMVPSSSVGRNLDALDSQNMASNHSRRQQPRSFMVPNPSRSSSERGARTLLSSSSSHHSGSKTNSQLAQMSDFVSKQRMLDRNSNGTGDTSTAVEAKRSRHSIQSDDDDDDDDDNDESIVHIEAMNERHALRARQQRPDDGPAGGGANGNSVTNDNNNNTHDRSPSRVRQAPSRTRSFQHAQQQSSIAHNERRIGADPQQPLSPGRERRFVQQPQSPGRDRRFVQQPLSPGRDRRFVQSPGRRMTSPSAISPSRRRSTGSTDGSDDQSSPRGRGRQHALQGRDIPRINAIGGERPRLINNRREKVSDDDDDEHVHVNDAEIEAMNERHASRARQLRHASRARQQQHEPPQRPDSHPHQSLGGAESRGHPYNNRDATVQSRSRPRKSVDSNPNDDFDRQMDARARSKSRVTQAGERRNRQQRGPPPPPPAGADTLPAAAVGTRVKLVNQSEEGNLVIDNLMARKIVADLLEKKTKEKTALLLAKAKRSENHHHQQQILSDEELVGRKAKGPLPGENKPVDASATKPNKEMTAPTKPSKNAFLKDFLRAIESGDPQAEADHVGIICPVITKKLNSKHGLSLTEDAIMKMGLPSVAKAIAQSNQAIGLVETTSDKQIVEEIVHKMLELHKAQKAGKGIDGYLSSCTNDSNWCNSSFASEDTSTVEGDVIGADGKVIRGRKKKTRTRVNPMPAGSSVGPAPPQQEQEPQPPPPQDATTALEGRGRRRRQPSSPKPRNHSFSASSAFNHNDASDDGFGNVVTGPGSFVARTTAAGERNSFRKERTVPMDPTTTMKREESLNDLSIIERNLIRSSVDGSLMSSRKLHMNPASLRGSRSRSPEKRNRLASSS
ncbi:hypothetical protein ACA910_019091 [Epithemia clementina (nom. ined.)]